MLRAGILVILGLVQLPAIAMGEGLSRGQAPYLERVWGPARPLTLPQ